MNTKTDEKRVFDISIVEKDSSSSNVSSLAFPLPTHDDPKLCRDEFLRQILARYTQFTNKAPSMKAVSIIEIVNKQSITAEALAILRLLEGNQFMADIVESEPDSDSITWEEKIVLFRQCNYKLQIASIEFVLTLLLTTIQICSNMWPGLISSIPHRLFAWSVAHFLHRVHLNQLYLDVLKRSMTYGVMDCYKFKIDCHELCLLIESILDDVRNGEDLFTSAMQDIRTAYYDEHSKWLPQCGNVREEREQVAKQLRELDFQLKMVDESLKMRHLLNQSSLIDANDPIENRYRLKWTYNVMDQRLHFIDLKKKAITNELIELKNSMIVDDFMFGCSENMYITQIESYKQLINHWQERYDKDLEEAELLCNKTKNSLQKVVDDMKFYREQKEFLIKRIAEVRKEISLEEELALERDRQRLAAEQPKIVKQQKSDQKNKKQKK